MKKNYTHITFVLDRSGSMGSIVDDAREGFNAFLSTLKADTDKEKTFTFVQFDHEYQLIKSFAPIDTIEPLTASTYVPRGTTALTDAIGLAIIDTGHALRHMKEDDRPDEVVLVIFTDGEENASTKFSRSRVKDMIKHQEDVYNWKVQFLAQNINAEVTGSTYGINYLNSATVNRYKFGTALNQTAQNIIGSTYAYTAETKTALNSDTGSHSSN